MKQALAAALGHCLLLSTSAIADTAPTLSFYVHESITPEVLGPIWVRLIDDSSSGCWTNLRNVREYTEERLLAEGFELAEERGRHFALRIHVSTVTQSTLLRPNECIGLVAVTLGNTLTVPNGPGGHFYVGSLSAALTRLGPLDPYVQWLVSEFFNDLRDNR